MATASKRLKVTQFVRGPREAVFEAFGDPKLARKWAPEGCRMASFEADMHVGGKFRQVMRCGGDRHVAYGEYRRIVPGRGGSPSPTSGRRSDRVQAPRDASRFKAREKGGTEIVLVADTGFLRGPRREAARPPGRAGRAALASFAKVVAARRAPAAVDRRRTAAAGIPVGVGPRPPTAAGRVARGRRDWTAGRRVAGTPLRTLKRSPPPARRTGASRARRSCRSRPR